jgi:hypothetical protein
MAPVPKGKGYEDDLASLLEDTSATKTQETLNEAARALRYQSRVIAHLDLKQKQKTEN